jgi:hypothetical protein
MKIPGVGKNTILGLADAMATLLKVRLLRLPVRSDGQIADEATKSGYLAVMQL